MFSIFNRKRKKSRDRVEIQKELEDAVKSREEADFHYDETTAVIDLTLERCKADAEKHREEMQKASTTLRNITLKPSAG